MIFSRTGNVKLIAEQDGALRRKLSHGVLGGSSPMKNDGAENLKRGSMAIRKMKEVSVLLTVQIDIVSKPHQTPVIIPPNVARAANFFQTLRSASSS